MSYKLKEWETWDSEAEKHPPKFCPNCGKPLTKIQEYWSDSSRPETVEDPLRGIGYDCFCDSCMWSGIIEPDADLDIVNEFFREGKS